MSASTSSSVPVVLVDTCVISGVARRDMKPEDAAAFLRMADMVQRSELTMWASTVAREEIDRIPPQFRADHIREYDALRKIRASNATWIDSDPGSPTAGEIVQHPAYRIARRILRDENDARLVFQAKAGGVTDFVTVDYNSVLNKAAELRDQLGIRAVSPSQYLSTGSTGFAA